MSKTYRLAILPGDGIGPEVTTSAMQVLEVAAGRFGLAYTAETYPFGGVAIDQEGTPLSDRTLDACRASDAVLMGAVGGPKWDKHPADIRPERGLLALRSEMGAFANLRPVRLPPLLADLSPLRHQAVGEGVDIVFVRELTGGLYFGAKRRIPAAPGQDPDELAAEDTLRYSVKEVKRVAEVAFKLASSRSKNLCSVDKENVLFSSRLWRETVNAVAAGYPDVKVTHMYVDNCAMQLVRAPGRFDVIVTENTFGDILSDLGGAIAGSLGLLPSASLGGKVAVYEPVHGSAPDIAGRGIANPIGAILSAAMMLRHTFGSEEAARAVEKAVDHVLTTGRVPVDLANSFSAATNGGKDAPTVQVTGTIDFGGLIAAEVAKA